MTSLPGFKDAAQRFFNDGWRLIGRWIRCFATGRSNIDASLSWTDAIPAVVGTFTWLMLELAKSPLTISIQFIGLGVDEVYPTTLGKVIRYCLLALWAIVSLVIACLKFRPSPVVVFTEKCLNGEEASPGHPHYRVGIKNKSRFPIKDCRVSLVAVSPHLPNLNQDLHCSMGRNEDSLKVTLDSGEIRWFDVCNKFNHENHINWGSVYPQKSAVGEYVVTLVARGEGVTPHEMKFLIKPSGSGLEMSQVAG